MEEYNDKNENNGIKINRKYSSDNPYKDVLSER
jgi:hypothetical protein